jgi:hypothetical protein
MAIPGERKFPQTSITKHSEKLDATFAPSILPNLPVLFEPVKPLFWGGNISPGFA